MPATSIRRRRVRAQPAVRQEESEASFQAAVLDLAGRLGWRRHHIYDSRKAGPDKGFPDLVLARRGRIIFAELKRQRGRVSTEQWGWLEAMKGADVDAYIWKPSDWAAIEEALA